ncbi:MAG: TetR/AcrR family transcriptional regulator [Christensenellales bacterium]|jgi:AcrR family transcriptional regulator
MLNDYMAENTKELLKNSLKELLNKKPISKISIRELTELVGVNRQTFYYHYKDIYDLVEDVIIDDFNQYKDDLVNKEYSPIINIYNILRKKKNVVNNIYSGADIKKTNRISINYVRKILGENLDSYKDAENLSEEDREFIIKFFSLVIVGVIHIWVEDGMPNTLYEDLNRIQDILQLGIKMSVDKLSNS